MSKRKAVESSGKKRPRHEKPGVAADSVNPFELRVNKRKHHVLGQRGARGERGMPGVSRAKAIEKRKRTLLKEYRERHKTNQLVDKRFGEYDENLTAEEKMMKRFMMEKQRKHRRKAMFNLEEEEGEGLTHYGQSLGDMTHFNELQLSSGEEDGEVDNTLTHFGGFLRKKQYDSTGKDEESNEEKPRTRKEVMEEVVAKAKLYKHERQVEKGRAEELLQQLDTDWKEVHSLLLRTDKQPVPSSSVDDYDNYLTELASQPRAKATDRIRSEDELGEEKRALMQKQKQEQLQRMQSTASLKSSMSAPHLSADYMPERGPKYLQQYPTEEPEPEGLQDTTPTVEEEENCEEDSEEACEEEDSEEECEEEDSEEEEGNLAEEMGSDLESDESEVENEEEREEQNSEPKKKKQGVKSVMKSSGTVIVPQSVEELSAMTEDKSPDQCGLLIERIHSSVTNKQSLEELFKVVVEFCLGDESVTKEQEDKGWFTDRKLLILNSLARPLFQLGHVNPSVTAKTFQQLLKSASRRLFRSKGKSVSSFPLPADLIMFKLVVLVFPMSDYRHPLTTPTMHLMALYLSKCHPASVRSIISGLFVCHCLYESISLSQRFVPELMNYLTSLVGCFVPPVVKGKAIQYAPFTSKTNDLLQPLRSSGIEDGRMSMLQLLCTTHLHTANTRLSLLRLTLKLLHQLAGLWKDLPMFDVVFKPALENTQSIPCRTLPQHIKEMIATLCDTVQTYSATPKPVLQLLKSKPASLKLFEPKYNTVYRADRRFTHNRTAGERQRLKHKVKREWKGAVREIRKDSRFLARVKLKDQLARDADRSRRVKQIDSWLQEERHETKMEKRGGGGRRRGGSRGRGRRQKT